MAIVIYAGCYYFLAMIFLLCILLYKFPEAIRLILEFSLLLNIHCGEDRLKLACRIPNIGL